MELSDAVGIIFVELTKLDSVVKKPVELMTGEEIWSVFFAYGSNPKYRNLFDKMNSARSEIKMATELLQTISRDEIERARFRSRRMFRMDMEHSMIVSRDEGREEGEIRKAIAIAKIMLDDEEPIEKIVKYTNLPREEIEGLRALNM